MFHVLCYIMSDAPRWPEDMFGHVISPCVTMDRFHLWSISLKICNCISMEIGVIVTTFLFIKSFRIIGHITSWFFFQNYVAYLVKFYIMNICRLGFLFLTDVFGWVTICMIIHESNACYQLKMWITVMRWHFCENYVFFICRISYQWLHYPWKRYLHDLNITTNIIKSVWNDFALNTNDYLMVSYRSSWNDCINTNIKTHTYTQIYIKLL